jgi:hypothetical protein
LALAGREFRKRGTRLIGQPGFAEQSPDDDEPAKARRCGQTRRDQVVAVQIQVRRRERLERSAAEEGFELAPDEVELLQGLLPLAFARPVIKSVLNRLAVESRDGQQRIARPPHAADVRIAGTQGCEHAGEGPDAERCPALDFDGIERAVERNTTAVTALDGGPYAVPEPFARPANSPTKNIEQRGKRPLESIPLPLGGRVRLGEFSELNKCAVNECLDGRRQQLRPARKQDWPRVKAWNGVRRRTVGEQRTQWPGCGRVERIGVFVEDCSKNVKHLRSRHRGPATAMEVEPFAGHQRRERIYPEA